MGHSDRIIVVGCGAVGLPIAIALAMAGFHVGGYDIDSRKVERLRAGVIDIRDPDLSAAYARAMAAGRLRFADALEADSHPCCFVVCVDTPATESGFDAANFDAAIAAVASRAIAGDAVLIRSTVPIGTTRSVARRFSEQKLAVDIAYCPDRTVAGRGYAELFEIPHVVAGIGERATTRAADVFSKIGNIVRVTGPETAEAVKLFANVQRDTAFGLANEFALICEQLGLDMYEILEASAQGYPRNNLQRPGPVGGPCLIKDTALLAATLYDAQDARIALAARTVNNSIVNHVTETILSHLPLDRHKPVVALIGVAYKGRPPTNETRGSFAVALGQRLRGALPTAELRAWDPEIAQESVAACGFIACNHAMAAAAEADAVVFTNDHLELAALDLAQIAKVVRKPALLYDLCGVQRVRGSVPILGVTFRVHGVGPSGLRRNGKA